MLICSGVDALARMLKRACFGIGLVILLFLSLIPVEEAVTPPTITPSTDTYPVPRDPGGDGYPTGTPSTPLGILLPGTGLIIAWWASVRRKTGRQEAG